MIILGSTVIAVAFETQENHIQSLVITTEDHAMGREEIRLKALQNTEINIYFFKCLEAIVGLKILSIEFQPNSKDVKFNFGKFETGISILIRDAEVDTIRDLAVSPVENQLHKPSVGWVTTLEPRVQI